MQHLPYPTMASSVAIIIRKWLPLLIALVLHQQAACFSLFTFPSVGSPKQSAKFPCKIVNATFVDCRNRHLSSVPAGIPVTTQTLLLSHNKIHIFNSTSLAGLVNLRLLNLSHNSISKLTKGGYFAQQKHLEHLYLSKNQINEIRGDAFMPLTKLKTLDLSSQNNGLTGGFPGFLVPVNKTLTTLLLKNVNFMSADFGRNLVLKSLKVLSLAANKITSLGKSDFQALAGSQLEVLDLSHNLIESIDTSVFSAFLGVGSLDLISSFKSHPPQHSLIANVSAAVAPIQIQKLTLRSLGLKNLTSAMFRGLANSTLKELDLSVNEIAELNDQSFGSQLTRLKVLQLYNNSITTISLGALAGLTSLESLNMEKNGMQEIKPGTFKHNTPLQILNLNDNSIASLSSDGSFQGLINLERLYLSKNRISQTLNGDEFLDLGELTELEINESKLKKGTHISLTTNSFKMLSKLKYLNLKKVFLGDIKSVPSPFAALLDLQFLDLSNNNMDDFHPDTLASLKSLETLYLDHNHFDNMWHPPLRHQSPVMFLRNLVSLRKLDLSFNGFESVPADAFRDLAHLKSLHLSNNKLSAISGQVFSGLKELEYLDLHKNQINVVNQTMLAPLLKTLKRLYICGNPFSCGCQQEWFRNWIDDTDVKVGNLSTCLCASPPDWTNKPLMSFHPEDLNCDHKLPLQDWIGIGVGSFLVILMIVSAVIYRWKVYYIYLVVRANHRRSKHRDYDQLFDYDAFISYSSADKEWVTGTLIPELERGDHPFRVCDHRRDFKPGKEIVDNIIQSVDNSRKTICVISKGYLESNWCSYERRVTVSKLFINYKDVLILIIMGDVPDKKLSKYDLIHRAIKRKTFLKWPARADERAVFWQRLKDVLSEDRTPERYGVQI